MQKTASGSFRSYLVGFLLSIVLTLAAYFLVVEHFVSGWALDLSVACLAIAQALVQLILFLHLMRESKPRWNLMVFLFTVLIVFIVVFGSLWIMNNLNYNLMPP